MSDVESEMQRLDHLEPTSSFEDVTTIPCSQETIPSTQDPESSASPASPASPIDPIDPIDAIDPNASFRTEVNEDRDSDSVIPSSLTPPPSSQQALRTTAANSLFRPPPQDGNPFTPPVTGHHLGPRDGHLGSEFVLPSPSQVAGAPPDGLRAMLQGCIVECQRLKMEAAHHKLQFNLLEMQAEGEASRAAIENDMTRREVEILKQAEQSRHAQNELALANESAQIKLFQLKTWYDQVRADNDTYRKRLRSAKKVIQQKEEEILALTDERDLLLTRIRENREHFTMLCSPGGIFHSAVTPKPTTLSTPQQGSRGSRRHTHASVQNDEPGHRFAALLHVIKTHENTSAPTTPLTTTRPAPRHPPKHTRAVQSLSSLPTTPTARPRGDHSTLLPSADLVPQTEPQRRYTGASFATKTSSNNHGRHSRESTISAEDNEQLARQAIEMAEAAAHSSLSRSQHGAEEEVYESQASQAASQMLRSDPRDSYEIANSAYSPDINPAPAEKTAKLQARLYGGVNKNPGSGSG